METTQEKMDIPGVTGNKMRTVSGRYVDFANPQFDQFTIWDIACGLGSECRFGNQLNHHYSVAEHSVHCLAIAKKWPEMSDHILRAVLMHDAAEAFCKDIPKPLKIMLPAYGVVESRMTDAIERKYNIIPHRQFVKKVDLMALKFEKTFFGSQDEQHNLSSIEDVRLSIRCWDRQRASMMFMDECHKLGIKEPE